MDELIDQKLREMQRFAIEQFNQAVEELEPYQQKGTERLKLPDPHNIKQLALIAANAAANIELALKR